MEGSTYGPRETCRTNEATVTTIHSVVLDSSALRDFVTLTPSYSIGHGVLVNAYSDLSRERVAQVIGTASLRTFCEAALRLCDQVDAK